MDLVVKQVRAIISKFLEERKYIAKEIEMSNFINDELETSFKESDESEKSDEDASDERVEYEKTFTGNFIILVNPKHEIQEGSG